MSKTVKPLILDGGTVINTCIHPEYKDGEMTFDVYERRASITPTVIQNITVNDAKVIRNRLNEFIDICDK